MNDLSFLRLEPIFNDAKYTRASTATSIFYLGQIILRPNETYLQTSNTTDGIAFDGNYKVTVVDCDDKELLDITNNVAIFEFTKDGVEQISFEITNIGTDFYAKKVFLKFKHTVSNYVWWTNAINITNYFDSTSSRFDYKNATDTYYQSIVLKCFFSVNDAESNSSEYTTQYGKKVTSRMIATELEQYFFDSIDNFTYRRLNNLLGHNVVYINGNRVTTKQTLPSKARVGDTNIFNMDFKVPIDYNETFGYFYQIFDPLAIVTLYPQGNYTLASLNYVLQGEFNRNVTLGVGTIKLFKDNVLFYTFTQDDITLTDNAFEIDLTGILTANGIYYVNISNGLFTSVFDEVYEGISNNTDWLFAVGDAEYDIDDYNNEYLIN